SDSKSAGCFGVDLNNLPLVAGLFAGITGAVVTKFAIDRLPTTLTPQVAQQGGGIKRPANDAITLCPKAVLTRNGSAGRLQIEVTEGMDAMVRPLACRL